MRKVSKILLSLLLIVVFAGPTLLQQPKSLIATGEPHEALRPLDDAVERILKLTGAPGAALAVARHGKLVYSRGYGFADVEGREPVRSTSRFRIASVSKPITAVAILKLVEEKRLALDDRVVGILKFSPPKGKAIDPRIRDIKVRDLLYHAGGWDRNVSGFDPPFAADRIAIALGERPPANPAMMVRFMLAQDLDFAPGSRQAYSNIGYAILGRIIEAVTGMPYGEYVRRAVLIPAKAPNIILGRSFQDQHGPDEVRYYDSRRFLSMYPGRGMVPAPYGAFSIEAMDAHGGWVASAADLIKFMAHFDLDPTIPDLLKAKTLKMMVQPHKTAASEGTFFAMGWEILQQNKGVVWMHRGDLPGSTALLVCAGPTQFAFLMNGNAGSRENADLILPLLLEASRQVKDWPDKNLFVWPDTRDRTLSTLVQHDRDPR